MIKRSFTYNLDGYNLNFILFVGLIFSETQFLYNFSLYLPIYPIPYFTLLYFLLSTAYLLYLIISYGLFFQKNHNASLELYEHIIFPLSVLIISILNRNAGFVVFKIVAILLLMVQSLLLVVKIVYFGSVTEQLAHITKVTRLLKMILIAVLPLFISLRLAVVVVISLCQLLSCSAYFFKFTYQHCVYEYLVLVGVFCGFISAAEDVFESIFGFPYLFIGEIASLYFYCNEDNYLSSVLQLKYINSLTPSVEIRHDDDYLAGFLFIEECLLTHKKTMNLSNLAKNEGTTAASLLIEKLQSHHTGRDEHSLSERDLLIQANVQGSQREIAVTLFEVIEQRFIDTVSFACFEFLINNGLELGGQYASRALVIYYKHVEKRGSKNTVLDRCKYELLYQRIVKCLPINDDDANQIKFIEFSESLMELNSQIETCINNQIRLIEYLTDDDKKMELFPDRRLLERHELKSRIRQSISRCVGRSAYTSSSEFKFLYILYHTCIEKKFEGTRHAIRRLFLSLDSRRLADDAYHRNNLVVLAGFNAGEIINSNEVFKSHFGITLNSFSRNNISEFLPSEAQRQRHSNLMSESIDCKEARKGAHTEYACLLVVQKELNNVKVKVVEDYAISTRVYYEHRSGFHYVCCLVLRKPDAEQNTVTLMRKDCESFESKGFQLVVRNQQRVQQLSEEMEICEIEFNYEGYHSMSLSDKLLEFKKKEQSFKIKSRRPESYLQEKLSRVEKNLLQQIREKKKEYTFLNMVEVCIILVMVFLLLAMFVEINKEVDDVTYVMLNVKTAVNNALLTLKKIILEQQMMSFMVETPYFADNICQNNGITNLTSYIQTQFLTDIRNSTDEFIGATTLNADYGPLVDNLFANILNPTPYILNYNKKITFSKYIHLMKSQALQWSQNLYNAKINIYYYSTIVPNFLRFVTIDYKGSLYQILNNNQDNFINSLTSTIGMLQVLVSILISISIIVIVFLRMRDNLELINYMRIIEFISPEMLLHRMRELKYSLNQLHRLKSNRIENVEIDRDFIVAIRTDKKDVQYLPLTEFTNWQISNKNEFEIQQQDVISHEQDKNLTKYHEPQSSKHLPQSGLVRVLIYNRCYLLIVTGIVVALVATTLSMLRQQNDKIKTLAQCDNASEELSRIQQKYINLVAYNWLKVYNLQQKFNFAPSALLLQEAISSLMVSDYANRIEAAYSKDISDQILYGNVCVYFNNPASCAAYRNNIFNSGFSMLLPFSIKEHLQIDNVSNSHLAYIGHLCDSSWLLFEGVIPMTKAIGVQSMSLMQSRLESGFLATTIEMCLLLGAMVLVTVVCQCRRYSREAVIREEVLSLDTVSNLYAINEFKPYFNKIYYS